MRCLMIAFLLPIVLAGCEMPISTWNVNEKVAEVESTGKTECFRDGFDHICLISHPVEVFVEVERRIEVPVEVIKEVEVPVVLPIKNEEGETKYIEVPGKTQIVYVETVVEVPVEVIKEVVLVVEKVIEKPVEKIKIVEKEVSVEVIKEVPVEVIKEVEKIIEVPVEKIVYRDIPGPTINIPFSGKIPLPDCGYGNNCVAVIENSVFIRIEYDTPAPACVVVKKNGPTIELHKNDFGTPASIYDIEVTFVSPTNESANTWYAFGGEGNREECLFIGTSRVGTYTLEYGSITKCYKIIQ